MEVEENKIIKSFLTLQNRGDIANLFGKTEEELKFILYHLPRKKRYTCFEIKKRSGGTRIISSPTNSLKTIQRKLNFILQRLYHPKHCVKGFIKGGSIMNNARTHVKTKYILNIDIAKFYDSINFGRVRGLFLKSPFNFNNEVATTIAQICCNVNALPQGAPTSPIISNMICSRLDSTLQPLAKVHSFFYTRYADDITLSTRVPFSKEIVDKKDTGETILGNQLINIFTTNGFELNPRKVRLLEEHHRQEVTGLVVNKKLNVRRTLVRQLRAMVHAWEKFGHSAAQEEFFKKYDRRTRNSHCSPLLFSWVVKGKLEFLGQVKGKDDKTYLNLRNKIKVLAPELFKTPLDELEKLYQQFIALKQLKTVKLTVKKIEQQRGLEFQTLLTRLFAYCDIPVNNSFTRNKNGEQIDGAFKFDNFHFITECKWQKKKPGIREVDSLSQKVRRSGKLTMGCFISINGWSQHVIGLVKQNSDKEVILIDGKDLDLVLQGKINLPSLLAKKVEKLNLEAEPFYSGKLMVK